MTAAGAIGDPAAPWPRPFVQGLYWTEMTVGSAYSTASRTVTEVDLMRFVSMGFTEPLFTDAAGAEAAGYRAGSCLAPSPSPWPRACSCRPTSSTGRAWRSLARR